MLKGLVLMSEVDWAPGEGKGRFAGHVGGDLAFVLGDWVIERRRKKSRGEGEGPIYEKPPTQPRESRAGLLPTTFNWTRSAC